MYNFPNLFMSETNGSEHELVGKLTVIADGLKNPNGADQYRERLIEMVATPDGRAEVRRALQFFTAERRLLIDNVIPDGVTISEPVPSDIGDDEISETLDGALSV